jgi:hypothetical protein
VDCYAPEVEDMPNVSSRRIQHLSRNPKYMEALFTINLSRGAYLVRAQDAERVLRAVEERAPHVLVEADLLGDGLHFAPVRIVVNHVISVLENGTEDATSQSGSRLSIV